MRSGVSGKVTNSYAPALSSMKSKTRTQQAAATTEAGKSAPGAKKKGTAVISIDELDRIRAQVLRTKEDSYEAQRNETRKGL